MYNERAVVIEVQSFPCKGAVLDMPNGSFIRTRCEKTWLIMCSYVYHRDRMIWTGRRGLYHVQASRPRPLLCCQRYG